MPVDSDGWVTSLIKRTFCESVFEYSLWPKVYNIFFIITYCTANIHFVRVVGLIFFWMTPNNNETVSLLIILVNKLIPAL